VLVKCFKQHGSSLFYTRVYFVNLINIYKITLKQGDNVNALHVELFTQLN